MNQEHFKETVNINSIVNVTFIFEALITSVIS